MMRERLVSEGLSLSVLSLAGDQRQLPYGDDYKEYVVHLDSGFAIHCSRQAVSYLYFNFATNLNHCWKHYKHGFQSEVIDLTHYTVF
jgi:hypothetical protein